MRPDVMCLRQLSLHNYRMFSDLSITFPDMSDDRADGDCEGAVEVEGDRGADGRGNWVTVIVGENGSGKNVDSRCRHHCLGHVSGEDPRHRQTDIQPYGCAAGPYRNAQYVDGGLPAAISGFGERARRCHGEFAVLGSFAEKRDRSKWATHSTAYLHTQDRRAHAGAVPTVPDSGPRRHGPAG